MRIAHLISTNFFGGPEKQVLEHARRLGRRGINVVLASFREGLATNELLERARSEGIETRELASRNALSPASVLDVVRMLKADRVEVLCTHGYKSDILGRLASWYAGIPQVVISRGWTGEDRKVRLYEGLDKKILTLANHVVPVSNGQKEKIKKLGVPEKRLTVIYNGVEVNGGGRCDSGIKREFGFAGDTVLVVSAGRLSPEKNYSGFIDAAVEVSRKKKNVGFIVFGEGPLRKELEKKIDDAGLGGKFLLPGFRKNVSSLFSGADIFVLSSFTEGLPNVVLEAYASGRPVVATAVGGTPEVVTDGAAGFLVDPGETGVMADRILTLASDAGLREEMGKKGYERVRDLFGFDSQTEKYIELYSKMRRDG